MKHFKYFIGLNLFEDSIINLLFQMRIPSPGPSWTPKSPFFFFPFAVQFLPRGRLEFGALSQSQCLLSLSAISPVPH